eukprot:1477314-Amphidinium_carterae.1
MHGWPDESPRIALILPHAGTPELHIQHVSLARETLFGWQQGLHVILRICCIHTHVAIDLRKRQKDGQVDLLGAVVTTCQGSERTVSSQDGATRCTAGAFALPLPGARCFSLFEKIRMHCLHIIKQEHRSWPQQWATYCLHRSIENIQTFDLGLAALIAVVVLQMNCNRNH